ncbi:hypothetical protein [Tropicimonas sp. IMCC6043]|uniref:hypothetical protein n=1 Tax=Tropicimonas sp. IMCC6043 TaxID=2510645 RepID=UPI00101DCB06|nr:hypothetical protein [Tropicimonas sp. IMCC6043]RYH11254.1 hypothetical protein EU800_05170 [Tropicimonas sp. IMCC6043]
MEIICLVILGGVATMAFRRSLLSQTSNWILYACATGLAMNAMLLVSLPGLNLPPHTAELLSVLALSGWWGLRRVCAWRRAAGAMRHFHPY